MKFIAIDTETHLIPSQGTPKINMRHEVPDMVVLTYAGASGGFLLTWEEKKRFTELLTEWAAMPEAALVFHNVAFDLGVITKWIPETESIFRQLITEGRIFDTRMMYLLRHPDPTTKGITLAYLAKRILHRALPKEAVRTSFRRGAVLTKEHREYAIKDALITREIAQVLHGIPLGSIRDGKNTRQKYIASHHVTRAPEPDVLYSSAAAYMAWDLVPKGMALDLKTLEKFHTTLTEEQRALQAELVELGYARVVKKKGSTGKDLGQCPDSLPRKWHAGPWVDGLPTVQRRWKGRFETAPGQVVKNEDVLRSAFEAFADDVDFQPRLSAKTHKISLARDDWKEVEGLLPADLKVFMKYQRVTKYLSSFIGPLYHACAREAKPNYWVHGAATGRWACSKPNLQQVPKANNMRSIYRARPGHVLVMADYPTLELYTLAHCMHCMGISGPLMEALYSGDDIHTRTAALMYNLKLDAVDKLQRQAAKASNFGLPGGMGWRRFHRQSVVMGLGWTPDHARETRLRWFSTYWDIKQYLDNFECNPYRDLKPPGADAAEWIAGLGFDPNDTWPSQFELSQKINGGGIYTCVLPTGRVLPDRRYSAAANSFFQGVGADVITQAFNQCCATGLNVVAVVHDSITLEVPEADARLASTALADIMADALVTVCPSVPRPVIDVEVSEVWK